MPLLPPDADHITEPCSAGLGNCAGSEPGSSQRSQARRQLRRWAIAGARGPPVSPVVSTALKRLTPDVSEAPPCCPWFPNGKTRTRQNRTWRRQDDGAPCEEGRQSSDCTATPRPTRCLSRRRLQEARHWAALEQSEWATALAAPSTQCWLHLFYRRLTVPDLEPVRSPDARPGPQSQSACCPRRTAVSHLPLCTATRICHSLLLLHRHSNLPSRGKAFFSDIACSFASIPPPPC
jgi:hypothetical protein